MITDLEKLKAVKSWPRQNNRNQLNIFRWLFNYFRWFISRFADIAKPLTRLTEDKSIFEWSSET